MTVVDFRQQHVFELLQQGARVILLEHWKTRGPSIDQTGQNFKIDLDQVVNPGLRTLITTSRWSKSRAAWTWPMEALPSGFRSNEAKSWSGGAPKSSRITSAMTSAGTGTTSSCNLASSFRYAFGNKSPRVERACPSLMNIVPSSSQA